MEDLRERFKIQPNTPMLVAWAPGAQLGMRWWEKVGIDLTGGAVSVIGDGGRGWGRKVTEGSERELPGWSKIKSTT